MYSSVDIVTFDAGIGNDHGGWKGDIEIGWERRQPRRPRNCLWKIPHLLKI